MKNNSAKSILINSLSAAFGLFLFGVGTYFTIQSNLGVAPWEALNLGLSGTFGVPYGACSITVSLLVLCVDILLKEKIGIGMFLDAFIVGLTVDLLNYIGLVPKQTHFLNGLVMIIAGMTLMCFSQYLYMKAALGCGPRDTMLVGISRRLPKVPIGIVEICILAVVCLAGWLLGGPIGIGTILCVGLMGPILQLVFKIMRFVAEEVEHQTIIDSFKIIFHK